MQLDYIIQGIIFSKITSTEFNTYYILPLILMFFITKNELIYNYISEKIESFFEDKNKSSLLFKKDNKAKSTMNFKALMHYVSTNPNHTIRKLAENAEFGWNRDEDTETEKFSGYRISQDDFKFDENVYGKFWIEEKKIGDINKKIQEFWNLEVYSYELKTLELIKWVENKTKGYRDYIKRKTYDKQIILDISYDNKENNIETEHEMWTSNVTFNNRFFDNKAKILRKIDFFLKNRDWYVKKGIPYTLGFLLHGKPGCGKTSFIKALLNYTKRHCINVKLTDNFDLDSLKEIIQKEKIEDYIIPNNNRILVFEDIDCMGKMVKKRKYNDEFETKSVSMDDEEMLLEDLSEKEKRHIKKVLAIKNKEKNTGKNNLSYFLNILDGLVEGDGRIIIMTTNKPGYLDPALIRPGRIDEKIEFKELSYSDIINILVNFYEIINIEKDKLISQIKKNTGKFDRKYTPAEFINICRGCDNINSVKEYFEIDE